jgi:hypothetical protein
MIKTDTRYLTFEEELLVAVYYNNVEKLKWLINMEYFQPSMVIEPVDFGDVRVPIYWLTICYHYMLRYEEYEKFRKPVDEILSIWKEQFHLDTKEWINLKGCYHTEKMPPVIKDDDKWWMGHLSLNDFLCSGAREVDYELYRPICAYDINGIVANLQKGGAPDAKVIDKNGYIRSAISMHKYWIRNRMYYIWGEETPVEKWQVESLLRKGQEEMILTMLEQSIQERGKINIDTFYGEVNMLGNVSSDNEEPAGEIKEIIDTLIQDVDKPGAVLTMFDEGKVFARCRHLEYEKLYAYIIKEVFKKSKHIVLRVGGYSYRVAQMALGMAKKLPKDRVYVEYLSKGSANEEWTERDPRIRTIGMKKYKFRSDMDIVKQAEEYDFKTFGNRSGSHTMVYYYVNNIDTGWYEKDGSFFPFYNNYRGLEAITDVIMINGYEDIAPASAVICTFTFDNGGDILLAGGSIHKDRRSRTSSQKKLIKDAGIKLLDVTLKR